MTSATSLPNAVNSLPTAIPLIVGVTGHRDLVLDDVPRIKQLVREVLVAEDEISAHTVGVVVSVGRRGRPIGGRGGTGIDQRSETGRSAVLSVGWSTD